jgi:hypothetical protein
MTAEKQFLQNPFYRFLFIGIVYIFVLLGYGSIPYTDDLFKEYDLHTYREIAEAFPYMDPDITAPTRFRILGPWMTALWPLPLDTGFRLTTLISLGAAFIFLNLLLKALLISFNLRFLLCIMLSMNTYLIGFPAWDYFQVTDSMGFAFLTGALWAGITRRFLLFTVFTIAGSLTRETCMFAILFTLVLHFRKREWDSLKKTVLASLPSVLVFFSMRYFFKVNGFDPMGGMEFGWYKQLSLPALLKIFVNAWSPLIVIPLLFWRRTLHFLSSHYEWIVLFLLVYLSVWFAEDRERLILPAAPAFLVLLSFCLGQNPKSRLFWCTIIGTCFISMFHHQMGVLHWPHRTITIVMRIAALLILIIVGFFEVRKLHVSKE